MGELSNTTINGVSYDFKDAGAARQSHSHTKSQITDFPTSMPASDVSAWAKASTKPAYTASEVGAIATTEKGAVNGVASLDSTGKVPSSQLPSYVDDVLEYSAKSSFPTTGETGKIYVDKSNNKTYRWSGSAYVEISESLALGETDSTAYRGDRGKAAYDHSQVTSGNPHNVTKTDVGLGNVGNFKAVSTVASQGLSSTEQSNARANIGAGTSSFSGSYNDLSNKPTIPTKTSQLTNDSGYTTNTGTYSKPSGGIPKSDLASAVQASLGLADSALQSFTETDPTVPSWAKQTNKPSYTQDEVGDGTTYKRVSSTEKNTWNNKGTYSKPSGGIPKSDLASAVQTSLGKADSALQSETDPTVPSWAKQTNKPTYNSDEISDTNRTNKFATAAQLNQISTNQTDILALTDALVDLYAYPFYRVPINHNMIYRGRNLGDTLTDAQHTALSSGNFTDLYLGDYWTKSVTIPAGRYTDGDGQGVAVPAQTNITLKAVIADFDTFYAGYVSNYAGINTHHAAVIVTGFSNVVWNSTNTTAGGYVNSLIHKWLVGSALPQIETWFGSAKVLSHQKLLTNAITGDSASGWAWSSQKISLLSENQMYSSKVWGGSKASNGGYEPGEAFKHLNIFNHIDANLLFGTDNIWLRDIASAEWAAFLYYYGFAGYYATSASERVPAALILLS